MTAILEIAASVVTRRHLPDRRGPTYACPRRAEGSRQGL